MAEKSKRTYRVSELVQSTIARVLQKEVSDPRLQGVTITSVDISPDLKNATVFFSVFNADPDNIRSIEAAFLKAAGFFRARLSQIVELRHTPKLTFKFDMVMVDAERVTQLLNAV